MLLTPLCLSGFSSLLESSDAARDTFSLPGQALIYNHLEATAEDAVVVVRAVDIASRWCESTPDTLGGDFGYMLEPEQRNALATAEDTAERLAWWADFLAERTSVAGTTQSTVVYCEF